MCVKLLRFTRSCLEESSTDVVLARFSGRGGRGGAADDAVAGAGVSERVDPDLMWPAVAATGESAATGGCGGGVCGANGGVLGAGFESTS
jgi:hypothetical protein